MKGRAEIARGGRVDGNITSKTLVVEEGAIFQGQSIMDQQPSRPRQAAGRDREGRARKPEEAKV